jgi:hypothetical protein
MLALCPVSGRFPRHADALDGMQYANAPLLYMYIRFLSYVFVLVCVASTTADSRARFRSFLRSHEEATAQFRVREASERLAQERCHRYKKLVYCSVSASQRLPT